MRLAAIVLLVLVSSAGAEGPKLTFAQRDGGKIRVVEVSGLSADTLKSLAAVKWDSERWNALLSVVVSKAGQAGDRPPLLGSHRIEGKTLVFEPRFPFSPGVPYRATFAPGQLPDAAGKPDVVTLDFSIPKPVKKPSTIVSQVYPSRDRLPENQLKFYLHFSAPMSKGEVYKHIRLLDERGKVVPDPFLELGEELWDPQTRRFTLFFDPGRIKRGLKPREEVGPALETGKKYTLVIDRAWQDADGTPLRETFRKSFSVGPPDDTCPDMTKWKLSSPVAGTTNELTVTLDEPLDHAMLNRVVTVLNAQGEEIDGDVRISDGETRWHFKPDKPWKPGKYYLAADSILEDLAGNSLARPFEVDVLRPARQIKREIKKVAFEVK